MTPLEWFEAHPDPGFPPDVTQAMVDTVVHENPALPAITALVIAMDRMGAERAERMVADGVPVMDAYPFVGSYSRIGWLLDRADRGDLTRAEALARLPEEWPDADPDDTDPRFLAAWMEAWNANGKRLLTDEPRSTLPAGRFLTIFRGQSAGDRPGIAWSLARNVAERFANGASVRVPGGIPNPVVLEARVHRRQVFAYMTHRGESEVIVNPFSIGRTVEWAYIRPTTNDRRG